MSQKCERAELGVSSDVHGASFGRPKGRPPAQEQAVCSAPDWAGWSGSARWPYRASDHSSLRVRSWQPSRRWRSARGRVVSPARSLVSAPPYEAKQYEGKTEG